jgi:hypothetical protein
VTEIAIAERDRAATEEEEKWNGKELSAAKPQPNKKNQVSPRRAQRGGAAAKKELEVKGRF